MGTPMKYATGMVVWMTHSGPMTGNFQGAYGFSGADMATAKQIKTLQNSEQYRSSSGLFSISRNYGRDIQTSA